METMSELYCKLYEETYEIFFYRRKVACREDTYIETTYISKTICRNFDY